MLKHVVFRELPIYDNHIGGISLGGGSRKDCWILFKFLQVIWVVNAHSRKGCLLCLGTELSACWLNWIFIWIDTHCVPTVWGRIWLTVKVCMYRVLGNWVGTDSIQSLQNKAIHTPSCYNLKLRSCKRYKIFQKLCLVFCIWLPFLSKTSFRENIKY